MKSGREPIIYSLNWEKFAIFFFLLCKVFAFPDLLFWERFDFFRKGVENLKRRFSSRGAAVAECQIEIENVLNSLLLPGSAENAPARRDHSETWQMPGYIKAWLELWIKWRCERRDFRLIENQVWGDQQLGRTSRNGGKNAGSGLSWRKYLGCLKWQGQYYRVGPSPTLRSFSKLRQNWEV